MSEHAADGRRCVSCNRWGGALSPGLRPGHVLVEDDKARGLCNEGPWHGSPRGVRNACGQWIRWVALAEVPEPCAAPDQLLSRVSS